MKITKERLKQIIKEELAPLMELGAPTPAGTSPSTPTGADGIKAAEFRKKGLERSRGTQTGIDDAERQLIDQTIEKLTLLAKQKSLKASGSVTIHLKKLLAALNDETQ